MKKVSNRYPVGWTHRKVAALVRHYDAQSEAAIVEEIEAASQARDTVLVQVPRKLLPKILNLVQNRKKSA